MEPLNNALYSIRGLYPAIKINLNKLFCEITIEAIDNGGARRFSQQRIDQKNLLSSQFPDDILKFYLDEQVRLFNKELKE